MTLRHGRGQFAGELELEAFRNAEIFFSPWSACHSYNYKRGTLRGLHYQRSPYEQAKLVTCVSGKVWDVIVDLRPSSPSYLQWDAIELEESSGVSIYVPRGCAHGFITLRDHSTVGYLIEGAYRPESVGILRWDDPAVSIPWPVKDPILSDADRSAPDYKSLRGCWLRVPAGS